MALQGIFAKIPQFTCFTGTKVQILTLEKLVGPLVAAKFSEKKVCIDKLYDGFALQQAGTSSGAFQALFRLY